MNGFINLHEESLYLKGARALLLRMLEYEDMIACKHNKESIVYTKAVIDEILHNRESLVKFLEGSGWRYYDHQCDKKNKLVSVKVKFNE